MRIVIADMVCCDYYSHRNFTKKLYRRLIQMKMVLLIDSNKSDITLITIDYINIV